MNSNSENFVDHPNKSKLISGITVFISAFFFQNGILCILLKKKEKNNSP